MQSSIMSALADLLSLPGLAGVKISMWWWFGLAWTVASLTSLIVARRRRVELAHTAQAIAVATVCAAVGAHLVALLFDGPRLLADPTLLWRFFAAGVSSLGAYLGALVGLLGWGLFLRHRVDIWSMLDAMAPGLCFAAATARLSCLMHGCDFGKVASPGLPWAIRYERATPAFRWLTENGLVDPYREVGIPMHPMPLYESLPLVALGVVALARPGWFGRRRGRLAFGVATGYAAIRLVAEGFRADITPIYGLGAAQLLCVVGLVLFAVIWWWRGPGQPMALRYARERQGIFTRELS